MSYRDRRKAFDRRLAQAQRDKDPVYDAQPSMRPTVVVQTPDVRWAAHETAIATQTLALHSHLRRLGLSE